jgi:hypothetical protein
MSWYNTGYDSLKKEEDRIALGNGPNRFWMPADSSKEFLFVTDEPFTIKEHDPKVANSTSYNNNELTCLAGSDDDVACCELLGGKSAYLVGYYTVIDLSKFVDRNGKTHQYELKMFPAKMRTLKKIRRKKQDRGSLVGCIFNGSRDDKKSPKVGDEFEFKKQVELANVFPHVNYGGKKLVDIFAKLTDASSIELMQKVFNLNVKDGKVLAEVPSFNYLELLKPRSAKEIRQKYTGVELKSFDDDNKTEAKTGTVDEEVPF